MKEGDSKGGVTDRGRKKDETACAVVLSWSHHSHISQRRSREAYREQISRKLGQMNVDDADGIRVPLY